MEPVARRTALGMSEESIMESLVLVFIGLIVLAPIISACCGKLSCMVARLFVNYSPARSADCIVAGRGNRGTWIGLAPCPSAHQLEVNYSMRWGFVQRCRHVPLPQQPSSNRPVVRIGESKFAPPILTVSGKIAKLWKRPSRQLRVVLRV
jgi:hypothetical protein